MGQEESERIKNMNKDAEDFILEKVIGHQISKIRPMTQDEFKAESWMSTNQPVMVIELDNGVCLYTSQDRGYTPFYGVFKGQPFSL